MCTNVFVSSLGMILRQRGIYFPLTPLLNGFKVPAAHTRSGTVPGGER